MIHRILHTSDWHIGRRLKEHYRTEEFAKFFTWLERVIIDEKIDTLLVAGDIFDNTTPSVQAQDMYYSFLSRLVKSPCRNVVIISGNHDSPAFLDAPAELLEHCRIHVVGQTRENPADEVITLRDSDGKPEVIVCAVPYLRDRDVRTAKSSEDFAEIERALTAGIAKHYAQVFDAARAQQGDSNVPIIAMGHMFIRGGIVRQNEGVRSLYVGTAIDIDSSIFPADIAYTALGHLHSPQKAGRENIRYSGSPIAMTFGESYVRKSVSIVELDGKDFAGVREIPIPEHKTLRHITGASFQELAGQLEELNKSNIPVLVDISYTGNNPDSVRENISDYAKTLPMIELLGFRDESCASSLEPGGVFGGLTLEEISPENMFERLMNGKTLSESDREIYMKMYREILHEAEMEGTPR